MAGDYWCAYFVEGGGIDQVALSLRQDGIVSRDDMMGRCSRFGFDDSLVVK
jgi:hypothetical protein